MIENDAGFDGWEEYDLLTMETASALFVPAVASLGELLPHDGLLSPEELEAIACGIVSQTELWHPLAHTDTQHRRYELIYEDERMDAWVLSWMPGQGTGFHDHYISSVGLCGARGVVREDMLRYGAEDVTMDLGSGDSRCGGPGYIHRVTHSEGSPAVTIHVYSPRLDWVGQYRLAEDGSSAARCGPVATSSPSKLVAAGALEHVLERF